MQGSREGRNSSSALLLHCSSYTRAHSATHLRASQAPITPGKPFSRLQACSCVQDRKEKDSFFNWFYFAINLGSFLAVTTLVYVQESVSWTIGFAIPAAAMLLAVVTFVAGSSKYVHVEPTERYTYLSKTSPQCTNAVLLSPGVSELRILV